MTNSIISGCATLPKDTPLIIYDMIELMESTLNRMQQAVDYLDGLHVQHIGKQYRNYYYCHCSVPHKSKHDCQ